MDLMLSAAVVVLFVLAAAAAWPAMYAVWSRAVPQSTELNLWRVIRLRGMKRAAVSNREPDLSRAVYRCIACSDASQCDRLLAAGRDREIDAFCPNRSFLDRAG